MRDSTEHTNPRRDRSRGRAARLPIEADRHDDVIAQLQAEAEDKDNGKVARQALGSPTSSSPFRCVAPR